MKTTCLSGLFAVVVAFFLAGCGPGMGGGSYGRSYDPFYGGYSGGNGGYYDPSYSSRNPYYGSGYYEPRSPWEAQRDHEQEHEKLDYKYDKAMRRLDRQEREAEEKLNRKYGGNTNDPRYQDAQRKVDQKYDHKRDKVERNTRKEHRDYHSGW